MLAEARITVMSALSRETLELISSWAEVLTALFGILAATAAVVFLLASKPLRKIEEHDNEVLQGKVAEAQGNLVQQQNELAKQKERTAGAEKAAADAALALARFREPRTLTPEQQDNLITALKPFAGQNFACAVFPDPEPLALIRLLDTLAKSANWKRVPSQIDRPGGVLVEIAGESAATVFDPGVTAYIAPDDRESVPAQMALCSTLIAAGIHCETHRTPQLAGKLPRAITISVGKKQQ
jgi:hypothetical protein